MEYSTLSNEQIVNALRKNGIPSYVSLSAGSYGCNQIFYHCMNYLKKNGIDIPAGFIHVPLLPEQSTDGRFGTMSLEMQKQAFEIILKEVSQSAL